jgi:hypothetical protein
MSIRDDDRRRPSRWPAAAGASVAALAVIRASPAEAHAFGQRYDLPVPLALYLAGAGAAVFLSFVLMAVFVRRGSGAAAYPRVNLLRGRAGRTLTHPALLGAVKGLSVLAFGLTILSGLFGSQNPTRNLAPTMVWIIWWVGLAFASALVGNLWLLLNPWRTVFGWVDGLNRRGKPGIARSPRLTLPRWVGVWPAVLLFLGFAWIELISPTGHIPRQTSLLALSYSAIVWTGMFIVGPERWLRSAEPFTLVFGLFSRFAPTELRVRDPATCRACGPECGGPDGSCVDCASCFWRAAPARREFNLRPFGAGLLRAEGSPSMTIFVILVLATVTFDGLKETPLWAETQARLYPVLPTFVKQRVLTIETLGLVAVPLLLLGAYLFTVHRMARYLPDPERRAVLDHRFVFTLVPIAIAYHLAHYLSFLLIQGQLLIPLLSDPFGVGWNLFGTASYRVNLAVVGARFSWYWAVASIVLGHVAAVVLAHHVALRVLPTRAAALRSQYPMMVLMIAYTMLSLWILAQPIVETEVGE